MNGRLGEPSLPAGRGGNSPPPWKGGLLRARGARSQDSEWGGCPVGARAYRVDGGRGAEGFPQCGKMGGLEMSGELPLRSLGLSRSPPKRGAIDLAFARRLAGLGSALGY